MSTKDRILDCALVAFATSGYDGVSLDDLARDLGISKQTILYHFASKETLLGAVVDRCADDVTGAVYDALADQPPGFARVERLVKAMFQLALEQQQLLGLLREVSRPGSPMAHRLQSRMDPLMASAEGWFQGEMASGRMKETDTRLLMLSAYSTMLGVATEVEVLRAAGVDPTLQAIAVRRRDLIEFMRRALVD